MTNKPKAFQNGRITETGLSDYHTFVSTFFKLHYSKLKPKISYYRNYKNFNEQIFLEDLEKTNFTTISDNPDQKYNFLRTNFKT